MCHLGNGRNVQHVSLRIGERFPIKRLRVRLHRGLPRCGIVGVLNERGANAQPLQRASKQGERAAVEPGAGHNMIPSLGQVQDRRGFGRLTRRKRYRVHTTLQGGQAIFQHLIGGIGEPGIDGANIL